MSEHYQHDPRILGSLEVAVDGGKSSANFEVLPKEIPGRIMDEIAKIAGDGKARVTVSSDFGVKNYGNGVSAMCSVTLTVNQDETSIDKAVSIAGDLARGYAQEQYHRAEQEFQKLTQQPGQGPNYQG